MAERQMFDMNSSVFEGDEMHRARDEENENKFIEENVEIISTENQQQKRRRYHRHTANQIQKMEQFFKDCPHPDKKQRSELGEEIGLEPLQVKFWFQNKRTQMKSKHERQENSHLRVENDKLQAENKKFREALMSSFCPSCGCIIAFGDVSLDDHHLRMENVRLREEINRISAIAAKYVGKPFTNFADAPSSSAPCSTDLGVAAVSIGKSSKGKEKAE